MPKTRWKIIPAAKGFKVLEVVAGPLRSYDVIAWAMPQTDGDELGDCIPVPITTEGAMPEDAGEFAIWRPDGGIIWRGEHYASLERFANRCREAPWESSV